MARNLFAETEMIVKNSHDDRKHYIGASDAAAVVGMSRWKTPLQIWAEKTGQVEPEDISGRLAVKLGNRLEEVVAELFTAETGKKVHRVSEPFVHKLYPFIVCHIDRKVDGESAILQCKTVSAWKAKEWDEEEIPHEYIIQEIHELACTGYDRAYIAVLIGNQDFKWKVIERDNFVINDLINREVKFWTDFVSKKVMPETITKDDSGVLFELFPHSKPGAIIQIGDKADILVDSIKSMQQDYNNLEGLIDQQKNELRALIGEAEAGEGIKWIVTNKTQSAARINTELLKKEQPGIYQSYSKNIESRVMRFKEKEK